MAADKIIGICDMHFLLKSVYNFWVIKETLVDYFKHVILITETNEFENNMTEIISVIELI